MTSLCVAAAGGSAAAAAAAGGAAAAAAAAAAGENRTHPHTYIIGLHVQEIACVSAAVSTEQNTDCS